MSNGQNLQLVAYMGDTENAGTTRTLPPGVRRKLASPTASQNSRYSELYLGNAVAGANGPVIGFVNATTGMVWDPYSKTWVNGPQEANTGTSGTTGVLSRAANSLARIVKSGRARKVSKARKAQSALSYSPKFGKRVRSIQENINKLETELKQANNAGNRGLVRQKRLNINRRTEEIVNLVNEESKRLQDVYKNLGINFKTTPKNELKNKPGALKRMINRIFGTKAKVSFSASRGPSERSLAGIAGAGARRARGRLPNYGGRRGTGSASAARVGVGRKGLPILLPPPQ